MTKHYDQDAACYYTKDQLTMRQKSRIDLDLTVAYWLAYIVPCAMIGGFVVYVLSSVVYSVRF